jgi:hypothetical protein
MVDFHTNLVSALNTVLPTHYEMALTANTSTPCISYMETNNYVSDNGSTLGYSRITYQIKIWATDIALIQRYAREVDAVVRPLGLTRNASTELYDNESAMIQKIMSYEGLALETY